MRNDFQSVYFFIERREGTFYKLEPWNKRKYVRPSRLRRIDAFDSILSRGGSRGGQSVHATHVKNAQVINIQS